MLPAPKIAAALAWPGMDEMVEILGPASTEPGSIMPSLRVTTIAVAIGIAVGIVWCVRKSMNDRNPPKGSDWVMYPVNGVWVTVLLLGAHGMIFSHVVTTPPPAEVQAREQAAAALVAPLDEEHPGWTIMVESGPRWTRDADIAFDALSADGEQFSCTLSITNVIGLDGPSEVPRLQCNKAPR